MKKLIAAVTAVTAVIAVTVAVGFAQAADLQGSFVGAGCAGGGSGVWHFVNPQTGGGSSTLDVSFTTGDVLGVAPSKVNKSVTQYYVTHDGFLQSAHTSLGGKIVVSDLTCESVPPPPPPGDVPPPP
jgi:hypothetical protein